MVFVLSKAASELSTSAFLFHNDIDGFENVDQLWGIVIGMEAKERNTIFG